VTRVIVVATSPAVRVGLTALLSGHPSLTVLESAAGPAGLDRTLDVMEADVAVVALEPGQEPSLTLRGPPDSVPRFPAVVLLGDEPASAWAPRALRSGARGALPRTATADQILAAVLAAAAGLIVRVPLESSSPTPTSGLPILARPPQALTPRELEILGLFAEGLGNKSIAQRLGISEHTVKTHATSVFTKLDVSTRAEAVAMAARLGLIML
jgi:NarL family two-component system response regulator YdfI